MSRVPDVLSTLCRQIRVCAHMGLDGSADYELFLVVICKLDAFRQPRGAPRYYWRVELSEGGELLTEKAGPFPNPENALHAALEHGVTPESLRACARTLRDALRVAQKHLDRP